MAHAHSMRVRAAGAALIVAVAGGAYVFTHRQLEEQRIELSNLRQELSLREQFLREEAALSLLIKDTERDRTLLNSYFFSRADPVSFLNHIEALDDITNTKLEVTKLQEEIEQKSEQQSEPVGVRSNSVRTTLDVTGRFEALYRMLTLLEHLPYALTVDTIVLERVNGSPDAWNGTVDLRVAMIIE